VPAGVDWYQARDYCLWLAEQSGRPFALPTEAQWEYAARSRGQMMPYATDDGLLRKGKNYSTREERRQASPPNAPPYTPYPIGKKYPPNPLGIHQMGLNGFEWVSDWYGEDYYERSPEHNPTGPASGKDKVRRGGSVGSGFLGKVTVIRSYSRPNLARKPPEESSASIDPDDKQPYMANTLRCVMNKTR
jgi:formylglycine-generating enzyme required for sulfatase activity